MFIIICMRLQEEWLQRDNNTLKYMTKKEFQAQLNKSALPLHYSSTRKQSNAQRGHGLRKER